MLKEIARALRNVSSHGDTDVFPFPFERSMFQEKPDACIEYVKELHDHFDDRLAESPPLTIEMLSQVGYTGFRRATLIEPFWNTYYLALVMSIAEQIEAHRIAVSETLQETETHASSRVRQAGANEDRLTGNLALAVYHHDTSRELVRNCTHTRSRPT